MVSRLVGACAIVAAFVCCNFGGAFAASTIQAQVAPWRPSLTDTFQWQLSGALDARVPASVYDVDAFDTPASFVAASHVRKRHVVCYMSAGSYESYRPDAASFPRVVLGAAYAGYPDERWLDIRRIDLLGPIMNRRLALCKSKRFDAVEPDNINGWENPTGFPLTRTDQIRYNRWFAARAHAHGLSVSLKNDGEQTELLLASFDFAITEGCWVESSCGLYAAFVASKKPVFTVEYTDRTSPAGFHNTICPKARAARMTAILKDRNLDAMRETCP